MTEECQLWDYIFIHMNEVHESEGKVNRTQSLKTPSAKSSVNGDWVWVRVGLTEDKVYESEGAGRSEIDSIKHYTEVATEDVEIRWSFTMVRRV